MALLSSKIATLYDLPTRIRLANLNVLHMPGGNTYDVTYFHRYHSPLICSISPCRVSNIDFSLLSAPLAPPLDGVVDDGDDHQ